MQLKAINCLKYFKEKVKICFVIKILAKKYTIVHKLASFHFTKYCVCYFYLHYCSQH